MSVFYVDFVKWEGIKNINAKSSFRDLEKEFLKKYKDREIIGFFEYKPYPLELTPVTLSVEDNTSGKYNPAPLGDNKKYVIITDKSKFTNETFKKTFENKTREAFHINMKRTENKDKYTFLKKNNLKADEYILPNPFGINLFEGASANSAQAINPASNPQVTTGTNPEVNKNVIPGATSTATSTATPSAISTATPGATSNVTPAEISTATPGANNLSVKKPEEEKKVVSTSGAIPAAIPGASIPKFGEIINPSVKKTEEEKKVVSKSGATSGAIPGASFPKFGEIINPSVKKTEEEKKVVSTSGAIPGAIPGESFPKFGEIINPTTTTTTTTPTNPSINPVVVTPKSGVTPDEILKYFKISEKDVPQKIKEFNFDIGKASSIEEMYNKTKQILGDEPLKDFYSLKLNIFQKTRETFGNDYTTNVLKQLIKDAIKVRQEQERVNLNLKLDNFESLLPIDLLMNQDALLTDVRVIVADPTLEKQHIYESLKNYLEPYYVFQLEENRKTNMQDAKKMFPNLTRSNEIETFYDKFSRDLMRFDEDENDSDEKLFRMFNCVTIVHGVKVFKSFEQLKYETEKKFSEIFKMSAQKAQELITEIEISLDLPLQKCSELLPLEKIFNNLRKIVDTCFEYEIFLLSLLDDKAKIGINEYATIYTLLNAKFREQFPAEKSSTEEPPAISAPSTVGIYLEKQQRALCGRHAINHLLQTEFLNDKKMEEFCGDPLQKKHGSIDEHVSNALEAEDEEFKNYFHCESSRGDNLNIDAVQRILIMSGYRVKNMGASIKKDKFLRELQKQMLIGIIVNTAGHYVAIVKFIPGKKKYTWIDSMRTSNLIEFDEDNDMLLVLQAKNFANYLFVYGTAQSDITPTFSRLNNKGLMVEYNEKYNALKAISNSLPELLFGFKNDFNKEILTKFSISDDLLKELDKNILLRDLIWNALLINKKIPESEDLIDDIIDADESLRLEPGNIDANELNEFLTSKSLPKFVEDEIFKSTQENEKFEPFMKCIQLYSNDIRTVLQKLDKHGIKSIYQFCYECNLNRDPAFWCNLYTLTDQDVNLIKMYFKNNVDNFKKFISNPVLPENPSAELQRFKKLVDLNKANPNKLKEQILISPYTGEVRKYGITFENRFSILSQYAFEQAKKNNIFEPLFENASSATPSGAPSGALSGTPSGTPFGAPSGAPSGALSGTPSGTPFGANPGTLFGAPSGANPRKPPRAPSGEPFGAPSGATPIPNPALRRGVPNVGNSCWANGVYQMFYDAEGFRNFIITTNWDQTFFNTYKTDIDVNTQKIGTLTEKERKRMNELENILSTNLINNGSPLPEVEKEFNQLNSRRDTSNWSWVPKDLDALQYTNVFGTLLKKIFQYIRGDKVEITYETTLMTVLLFPANYKNQQDSGELIESLRRKTDIDNGNMLKLPEFFGFTERTTTKIKDTILSVIPRNEISIQITNEESSIKKFFESPRTRMIQHIPKELYRDNKDRKLELEKVVETLTKDENGYVDGTSTDEYINFSKYLLISFPRTNMIKIITKITPDEKITLDNNEFILCGILVHSGETVNSGHYYYESIKDKLELNDSTKTALYSYSDEGKAFVEKNWTALLYEKVEKKTSGGKKTHKLRIKLNNKNKKSLRHKTRDTINRL